MQYAVKTVSGTPDWAIIPRADIASYRWLSGYEPKAYGQVALGSDRLFLRLVCHEKNPRITFTEPGSLVCQDSCLEFFFSLNDANTYINLEFNAGGCYFSTIGTSRYDRVFIKPFEHEGPTAHVESDRWEITATVLYSQLCELFGCEGIDRMRGNFFKCGDHTEHPHYGMWSASLTDTPDFHQSKYFGDLIPESPVRF